MLLPAAQLVGPVPPQAAEKLRPLACLVPTMYLGCLLRLLLGGTFFSVLGDIGLATLAALALRDAFASGLSGRSGLGCLLPVSLVLGLSGFMSLWTACGYFMIGFGYLHPRGFQPQVSSNATLPPANYSFAAVTPGGPALQAAARRLGEQVLGGDGAAGAVGLQLGPDQLLRLKLLAGAVLLQAFSQLLSSLVCLRGWRALTEYLPLGPEQDFGAQAVEDQLVQQAIAASLHDGGGGGGGRGAEGGEDAAVQMAIRASLQDQGRRRPGPQ